MGGIQPHRGAGSSRIGARPGRCRAGCAGTTRLAPAEHRLGDSRLRARDGRPRRGRRGPSRARPDPRVPRLAGRRRVSRLARRGRSAAAGVGGLSTRRGAAADLGRAARRAGRGAAARRATRGGADGVRTGPGACTRASRRHARAGPGQWRHLRRSRRRGPGADGRRAEGRSTGRGRGRGAGIRGRLARQSAGVRRLRPVVRGAPGLEGLAGRRTGPGHRRAAGVAARPAGLRRRGQPAPGARGPARSCPGPRRCRPGGGRALHHRERAVLQAWRQGAGVARSHPRAVHRPGRLGGVPPGRRGRPPSRSSTRRPGSRMATTS